MSVADLPINLDRQKIAEFCRARGIRKLSLFGSVLRADFDRERSDVDVLADFEPEALAKTGWEFFLYGQQLGQILGYKVDLCAQLSEDLEPDVRREALTVYEQA
jgi:predicted nucleotidyltransferase